MSMIYGNCFYYEVLQITILLTVASVSYIEKIELDYQLQ